MIKYIKKNKIDILLIALCIILVSIPSFKLFSVYDAVDLQFHIKRFDGLVESFNNFVFPYRINSLENLGYGGASPIMYPHLFFIVPAILYKIVHDYSIVVNITNILINIMTAVVMYYSSYQIFKSKRVSLVSTIVFLLSAYRVALMHGAAAFGEYVAIAFIPLVAEGYTEVLRGNYKKYIDLLIGLTCICEAHIITIFFVSFALLIISLFSIKKILYDKKVLMSLVKCAVLFILLNLWFLVPFIHYYVKEKLIFPVNGFNLAQASVLGLQDQITLPFRILSGHFRIVFSAIDFRKIGLMTTAIILFIIYVKVKGMFDKNSNHIDSDEQKICNAFLIIFVITIIISSGVFTRVLLGRIGFIRDFFMLQQMESRAIGRGLPLFYMAFAYLLCQYFKFDESKIEVKQILVFFVILLLAIIPIQSIYSHVLNNQTNIVSIPDFANSDYMLQGTITGEKNIRELVKQTHNMSLPKDIFDGNMRIDSENLIVTNEKKGYLSYTFDYENLDGKAHFAEVPYFRYIGFKAFNKKNNEINTRYGNNNLVRVNIKDQKGRITVKFVEPILWRISELISLFTIIVIIIISIVKTKSNNIL